MLNTERLTGETFGRILGPMNMTIKILKSALRVAGMLALIGLCLVALSYGMPVTPLGVLPERKA